MLQRQLRCYQQCKLQQELCKSRWTLLTQWGSLSVRWSRRCNVWQTKKNKIMINEEKAKTADSAEIAATQASTCDDS